LGRKSRFEFDEIGYWSEIKLNIIKEYAKAFSTVVAGQKKARFYHIYIDAFAGAGVHISSNTGEFVSGSPMNVLCVEPPFREYHFIDLNKHKVAALKRNVGERSDVRFYVGDCNKVLLEDVFPKVRYDEFKRGLCLLDPYGLHLNWEVIESAGSKETIEILLNFPVMDMNMNVLLHKRDAVDPIQIKRMNSFWGDESWRNIAYTEKRNLFGWKEKTDNETVAEGFRMRLREVAGFEYVPKPLPMRNTQKAIVYYLFFASQNKTGGKIIGEIFNKYR
jgi:three-Cys-motif partner protein